MKIFALLLALSITTVSALSQTIKENIDKAAKDKNTKDRAAKADVLIQPKTITPAPVITAVKVQPRVIKAAPVKKVKYKHRHRKHKIK